MKALIPATVTALILVAILGTSIGTIDAGERGVRTRFGALEGTVEPGLYFKNPFTEDVVKMDVRRQSLLAGQEGGSPALSAASNDLQDTSLSVVVNYHIDPNQVADIYRQSHTADIYYTQVVDPLIIATIKSVASQYSASEQIQKRQEMSDKTLVALQKAFDGKNVSIEKADITNIAFSPQFAKSIEAKVTAVQDAITAQNKVQIANAEAQAIRIKSEAANNEKYIQLQQLEVDKAAIAKWDGRLPSQMIPGQSVPFINVNK